MTIFSFLEQKAKTMEFPKLLNKMHETTVEVSQLVARELASAVNTPKLLEEHAKVTNGFTRTRFPPEVRDICCFNFRPLLFFLYQF